MVNSNQPLPITNAFVGIVIAGSLFFTINYAIKHGYGVSLDINNGKIEFIPPKEKSPC